MQCLLPDTCTLFKKVCKIPLQGSAPSLGEGKGEQEGLQSGIEYKRCFNQKS